MRNRILIIDDDTRNIFALGALLRSRGHETITATSAKEGIEFLKNDENIAIVLMDMMMPEMDGYEALGEIRALERNADIAVIAVTAQAMTGDREKCLAAGADGYISKPVDVDLLVQYLQKHVEN